MDNQEGSNQSEAATNGSQVTLEITEARPEYNIRDEKPTNNFISRSVQAANESKHFDLGVQLHQATLKGDWEAAKTMIDKQQDIVRLQITSKMDTALHVAVAAKRKEFVRNLLGKMSKHDVALQNIDQNTAFFFAAATGDLEIAEMLINKNKDLPNIEGGGEMTPIHMAALFGRADMVIYLYEKTDFNRISVINLMNLFLAIISADIYDIALRMLQDTAKINLAISRNSDQETALHVMARKPSVIFRNSQLNLFQKLANSNFKNFFCSEEKVPTSAHRLVEELWKSVMKLPKEQITNLLDSPTRLLFAAAESGNVEFLVILIRAYPDLIWKVDDKSRSIFHIAALNRHENIFKIIFELGGVMDMIASYKENGTRNNLLHLVACLPPPNRLQVVSGAALQMQREILWFKAIEKIVPHGYIKAKNTTGDIAHDLFTKQHETLRIEGEKWMKDTTNACILVATLIATVVFAAALTVPGGYDESTEGNKIAGFPRFRKKFWFDMFILSDSVSLFSSVIAIAIFLSILTSRYAEADFRRALPTKLMMGLLALFVSIISMVLAFTLTVVLIRHQEPIYGLILIICLASLTAILFTFLHLQLWLDTVRSALFSFFFLDSSVYFPKFLLCGRKSGLFP